MKPSDKAKLTKEKNLQKAVEQLGLQPLREKVKAKRKPMTAEQKEAAAKRLEKARSKRKIKNVSIHETIRDLPDDDSLSPDNVKSWIKHNKEYLKSIRTFKDSGKSKERSEYKRVQSYIKNLQTYLRTGVYLDFEAGADRQEKIQTICKVMAYNPDGTPKRTVGTWYPDIRQVWTTEMEDDNVRGNY